MGNVFGNGNQQGMTPMASVHLDDLEGGGAEVVHNQSSTWDAMETYFECITTCSLEDGECVTRCVEELREKA